MSIGADVARIKGNITAALAAIADKGVTVPDGSTSDALAGLIASIEAGGGLAVRYGTVTIAESSIYVKIEHDLGRIPVFYMAAILPVDSNSFDKASDGLLFMEFSKYFLNDTTRNNNKGFYGYRNSNSNIIYWQIYSENTSYDDATLGTATKDYITIGSKDSNSIFKLPAGSSYFYMIMG